MSTDNGDEVFASADEGSDNDLDLISSSHEPKTINKVTENVLLVASYGSCGSSADDPRAIPKESTNILAEQKVDSALSKDTLTWNDENNLWEERASHPAAINPKENFGVIRTNKMSVLSEQSECLERTQRPQDDNVPEESDILSKVFEKADDPVPVRQTDLWNVESDPWTELPADSLKFVTSKESAASDQVPKSSSADVWDLEDDPWVESKSEEQMDLKFDVGEKKLPTVKVEESDAWDLEDDLWTSSDVPVPVSPKMTTDVSTDEWDNLQDLHAKLSLISVPSNPSQELVSTATALVKSVGGGLASFVGGLKLPTLSIFEDAAPQESRFHSEIVSKPQDEVSQSAGGGWSAWNLGLITRTLTSTVENTGMQLIHGGVDVLEQIGRKTFAALKENDPGLVYTKRFLRPVDPSPGSKFSQILREAGDHQTLQLASESRLSQSEVRRGDLTSQLESRLALVHMEALELLGSRASARLITMLTRLEASHETHDNDVNSLISKDGVLERILQILQLKDREADSDSQEYTSTPGLSITLSDAVKVLDQVVPGNALLKTCDEVQRKSRELEIDLPMKEIFYRSIEALAESTSVVLAYLHKLAECLLIGQHRDRFNNGFLDITEKVAGIITATKRQNETLCSNYVEHLKRVAANNDGKDATKTDEGEETLTATRRLVASLFLETGMANGYLDDSAANYLVPVLQVACLDAFLHEPSLPSAGGSHQYPPSPKPKMR